MSRPTISRTICVDGDVGRCGAVATYAPSRITVTRVAQAEDLVEAVRDEEDAAALVAQAAGDGEQPLHLDAAEGGGRLVHDQHFGVQRDGLGDLDDLLVGDRQAVGACGSGSMRHAEPLEQLRGLGVHRAAVDAAEPAVGLAAHEDVLGDRQVREERRLLVDDRDAGVLRSRRRLRKSTLWPADLEVAGVAAVHAGDDLDQRRLAGAVLADECVDFAGLDVDGAAGQGTTGPKVLAAWESERTGTCSPSAGPDRELCVCCIKLTAPLGLSELCQ